MSEHVLDNPAWHALGGPQAGFAETAGPLRYYRPDVALFGGTATAADHAGLARWLPASALIAFWLPEPIVQPAGVDVVGGGIGVQMVADHYQPAPSTTDIRPLGDADVPAMLELTRLTKPGPFMDRTHTLGAYLGAFDGDRLVGMAGERMKPPGYTEISAVCTHPDYRGRGLARTLMTAVADLIVERGETPMLHVFANNHTAIAVYESLGFVIRRSLYVTILRPSGGAPYEEPEYMKGH